MMDDMKKNELNELNEQELNQVTGGGIIQDVKDALEIAKTVSEMISGAFTDGSEGKNENQNSDIINHGSGASGSWNENQNSDIISHGSGASGSW